MIPPFEPNINAAKLDVEAAQAKARAEHAGKPDEWLALAVNTHHTGAQSVALFKPDSLRINELKVSAAGRDALWSAGPDVVVVLTTGSETALDVVADHADPISVPIRTLP